MLAPFVTTSTLGNFFFFFCAAVSVLCDGAARYQSRLFSKSWLTDKGLLDHIPQECRYLVTLD